MRKNIMADLLIYILTISSFTCSIAFAADNLAGSSDITKIKINTESMEKSYTSEPEFSSEAANQKEASEIVEQNEARFTETTVNNTEELFKCGKLHSVQEVKDCRDNILMAKKK